MVVEGPTDFAVLDAVLPHLLKGREYVSSLLQPDDSESDPRKLGGGWGGVCKWLREAVTESSGRIVGNSVLGNHDLLVVQVDADVAQKKYSDYPMLDDGGDLPCPAHPCPPPAATTNELRKVVLRWMGESTVPSRVVLCTPSKALETWLLAALYPDHAVSKQPGLECRPDPEATLGGMPAKGKLVRKGKKDTAAYAVRAPEVAAAWPTVRTRCTEAERFSREFIAAVPAP